MKVKRTERGFERIDFMDNSLGPCSVQQSSVILDYPGSLQDPGSSALWLGRDNNRMHLDRDQVRELVAHLQAWLETGSLELPQEKPHEQQRQPSTPPVDPLVGGDCGGAG